ncbi:MAG: hypothetical protein UY18_C0022G0014 [Microgenomates group bacterium GW2011_GWF2_47_9]|nr:MAG: hypothetical protein UY18_C0022G0014 [Microgenomates group bacterium GW2011_GWF2_47_9]
MSARFTVHSLLLTLAILGVYLWATVPTLSSLTLQYVALLILAYAATHWLKKSTGRTKAIKNTIPLDLTLLTSMVLILVVETGALVSPLFFLLYFLLFAVALMYEIEATLLLTSILILFFLLLPSTNLTDLAHLAELFALLAITPLAIFTGHEYELGLREKRLRAELTKNLGHEETDTLMFLSLSLKSTLISSLDRLSLVIPQTKVKAVRGNLELLYQDLKNLYHSADELEQAIDQESD